MGSSLVYMVMLLFFLGGTLFTGYISEHVFLIMNVLLYLSFFTALLMRKKIAVSWLHLPIALFVISYWLACINAIDTEAAVLEALRVTGLLPISLMIPMLTADKQSKVLSLWPWLGSFLVVIGVVFQMEREGRLESTLEYANTLALFLLVGVLLSILSYAKKQSKLQLILLTVNAAGLLLTFSRSVWILWFAAVVIIIVMLPSLRTKKMIWFLAMSHLAGLMIAMLIKQDMLFFVNRVASIQANTSEFQIRLVYWQDSIKMFFDHMWLGTGGGGWTVLQYEYQSQAYYVKYIHNHFAQVFLDTGLIGGVSWLALLFLFFKVTIKAWKASDNENSLRVRGLLIIVPVMLLHAGFDFDLTFPLMFGSLIFFMLLMPQSFKILDVQSMKQLAALLILVMIAGLSTWIGTGYQWKEQGVRAARAGNLEQAQEKLKQAERAIPWSSSILYETAKVYVRMGNETKQSVYYELAEQELLKARLKVPQQKLYINLLNDIYESEK